MAEYRSIEIDFEVHKRIEAERRGFLETPNDVLRRRFGIGAADDRETKEPRRRPWSGKGVVLPDGTEVSMEYNGTAYRGRIEDGAWVVEGLRFNSPSAAAGGVAKTKAGKAPSLDGWIYWHVRRPGDDRWLPLEMLRDGQPAARGYAAEAARLRAETAGRRHTDSADLIRADRDRA